MRNKSESSVWKKSNRIQQIYVEWLIGKKKSQSALQLYSTALNNFNKYLHYNEFPILYGMNPKNDIIKSWKQSLYAQHYKENTVRNYCFALE